MFTKWAVAGEIVFFNIFGIFGNVNLIYLTATNHKLKSKSSFLQCILAFSHIICLLFELPNSWLSFTGIQLRRNECFPAISLYIFFICFQALIVLMLVIDLYMIVFFPTLYQTVSNWKYITSMLILPILYATFIVVWGFLKMDDKEIMFCNPPISLHPTVSRFWTFSNVVINTVSLFLLIIMIIVFHFRGKNQKQDTRKVMRRLKTNVAFFVCTWYIALLAADLFVAVGIEGELLIKILSNLVLFALVSYSMTFYIILWRSIEYRIAFLNLWSFMPCVKQLKKRFGTTSTAKTIVFSIAQATSRSPSRD